MKSSELENLMFVLFTLELHEQGVPLERIPSMAASMADSEDWALYSEDSRKKYVAEALKDKDFCETADEDAKEARRSLASIVRDEIERTGEVYYPEDPDDQDWFVAQTLPDAVSDLIDGEALDEVVREAIDKANRDIEAAMEPPDDYDRYEAEFRRGA